MIGSPVLDLILLLSFTYFIGALLLAAINEGVSQGMLRFRQKGLKKGIEHLFFNDAAWLPYVKNRFMKSPHIVSLLKKENRYPAYIPANNFLLTVIEAIGPASYNSASLQAAIAGSAVLPEMFKKVLLDLAVKAGDDLKEFEKNVTQFYNDAMDRASGWYKKRIRRMLLLIGVILSVALNIDTIKITNDALKDTTKLKQTADRIMQEVSRIKSVNDTIIITDNKDSVKIIQKATLDTNAVADGGATAQQTVSQLKNIRVVYESTTGVPLGYMSKTDFFNQWGFTKRKAAVVAKPGAEPAEETNCCLTTFLLKLAGIIITAFALQLGSNYWFDILNKVGSIRGVGKKPDA